MSDFIPLSVPTLAGREWEYVKECLDTEWVSSAGKYVELFEARIAEYTGAKHAIACVNGTSALQVSLRLAGVASGDEVILPSLTFIAPVNAVHYCGAQPVFMDADQYFNLDMEKALQFINSETVFRNGFSYNVISQKKIAAIVPVHIWGNACRMDELVQLCADRNIAIVEDASESLGTVYQAGFFKGRHTGTIGKFGCISFNGNKIITSGGGGMILTDDGALADKARYLTTQAKDDAIRYVHHEVGYNFRLTNIQAALGVAQLEQLPGFLKQKRDIYEHYRQGLAGIPGLELVPVPEYSTNNHWLSILSIDGDQYGLDREAVMASLNDNQIQTRPVWHLNHLQQPYQDCQNYLIEKAQPLVDKSLCLPSSVSLSSEMIKKILMVLRR
jgi:perosamine synthetase